MPRLPGLTPDKLTVEQKELYDTIAGDKRRFAARGSAGTDESGALSGPFNALLHAPQLGHAAQRLGAILRFESSLPGHLRELAILIGARHWRANYEWFAHAPIAAREGLDHAIIDAVKEGEALDGAPDDVMTVHRFVSELVENKRVGDKTYEAAREAVGERGLVELIAILGHYTLIAGLLNVFQVGLPEGEELHWPE
jgi:4-carboxymuconolactone decarboxylase